MVTPVQRKRRFSYVLPPPLDPPLQLQLPPHGYPKNGSIGPIIIPLRTEGNTQPDQPPKRPQHSRHRLGVACLALDTSTQLVGRANPEGILYSGGRDGPVISWDLGIPTKKRAKRYSVNNDSIRKSAWRWEVLTGWADDTPEDDGDEGEEGRDEGDILEDTKESGGGKKRGRRSLDDSLPFVEQWEFDVDGYQGGSTSIFRQSAQLHSDWVNDIVLANYNQTVVTASSDGTVKAWNPHDHSEPSTIGQHADYVRCLSYCREQNWVASGSFDRTVKIWDLATAATSPNQGPLITLQAPEASGPKASIYALAADPCGTIIATGSPERVIRMWDPRSGKRVGKLVGHTDNIRAILVSEDARYLLTGSADASIKLWSLSSQRCLHTFTHHTESVWSLSSSHPTLETFYSGDRSGLICRVDVENCADVSEGECIVLCQENNDRGSSSNEGINKIVAMDDNLLWTASGNSSIRRWKVPGRRATRAAVLGEGAVVDSPSEFPASVKRRSLDGTTSVPRTPPSPTRRGGDLRSAVPSVSGSLASESLPYPQDKEGNETWYGVPFESLVKLTSPNEAFSSFGGPRAKDPEIATLYSAASVMSVPRVIRSPMQMFFHNAQMQRSSSPMPGETVQSKGEETLHPARAARLEYEEREVAADAVPLYSAPDEIIQGEHGLVRAVILNDRIRVLTVDTAGEVAVWDILRGTCLGKYASEDVSAASFRGSNASDASGDRENSPREALETVRERIEGEAVVVPWATVDTKMGVLTIHLNEKCFDAEIYADEAGYTNAGDQRFNDEIRLNLGKWLLRNIFLGFIKEQQRSHRARETSQDPNQRLSARDIHRTHSPESPRHSSSDRARSNLPRSTSVTTNPDMAPAMTPVDIPRRTNPSESSHSLGKEGDYFSRPRQPTSGSSTAADDKAAPTAETPATPALPVPSTPNTGFMGRLKAFGKHNKKQASESSANAKSSHAGESSNTSTDSATNPVPKTPLQTLLAEPISPPPSNEAPSLPIPPDTSIIISEENQMGWTTVYRGYVSDTSHDVRILEEAMPIWLLEYLLANKTPSISIVKISFILLPYPTKDGEEQLPELLNTSQAKLTASRFLRVKKLTQHVQDKLDKISTGRTTGHNTPRSSIDRRSASPNTTRSPSPHLSPNPRSDSRPPPEELFEILCNDMVLPLNMSLAAVRQYVWRQAGELTMHYRRRTVMSSLRPPPGP